MICKPLLLLLSNYNLRGSEDVQVTMVTVRLRHELLENV